MERSEQIGDLMIALAKAQSEFTFAAKESENPAFHSKYADLASVIAAVRPSLSKNGIAFLQFDESDVERQTASVTTALYHGEQWISITSEAPAAGMKGFNVQSLGAAWTYLRRYTLQAVCGLASDDDDGNSLAVENPPVARRGSPSTTAKPSEETLKLWSEAFEEAATIDEWNKLIVPMVKERMDDPSYGRPFALAAANTAKFRGWIYNRNPGIYELPKGKDGEK